MRERNDLLDTASAPEIEVLQLTEEDVPSCHIYMEAQVCTPDSRYLVLQRATTAHSRFRLNNPEHRYVLCDTDNGALLPLTDELNVAGPSLSPDGKWMYYFTDDTQTPGIHPAAALKRVSLDGLTRETLLVIDTPLSGSDQCPWWLYPLSTISSDGKRLAISANVGKDSMGEVECGLIVFDLESATADLVLKGRNFGNLHPQYCRSIDPEARRDILIQENHLVPKGDGPGFKSDPVGGDIHVVRDDGARMRDLAWGRAPNERCQGHQCWVGRATVAMTSTCLEEGGRGRRLIAGAPVDHAGHLGKRTPGGVRNDLSRDFPATSFCHFGTDLAGRRLVTDYWHHERGWQVYAADLPARPLEDTFHNVRYLLTTACPTMDMANDTHAHPFCSPDGTKGFFNSDESGVLQAYMIRGL